MSDESWYGSDSKAWFYVSLVLTAMLLIFGLAAMSAPTAKADINVSGINFGTQGNAEATFGNVAIAGPGTTARANGGIANIAVAVGDGEGAFKAGPGSFNAIFSINGFANVDGNSSFNIVGSGNRGTAHVANGNGHILFAGRNSGALANNANLSVTAAFCGGTAVTAQSAQIRVSGDCRSTDP